MTLWQWLGLAVSAAVLCSAVRAWYPPMAGLCAVAAGGMLLLAALESVGGVGDLFVRLSDLAGLKEESLQTLFKVLGVSYATELAAQTCEDLGEGGLGMKVALLGKLCVFSLAAPMLVSLLEMILALAP